MARRRFVVVGAGGHAKVVVATIESCGDEVIHLLDDDVSMWGTTVLGHKVQGPVAIEGVPADAYVVLAVGSNSVRRTLAAKLPARFGQVTHSSAIVHHSASLGEGTVVFAGAVVQPDARVGPHCIINTSASIDHDCQIGAFVHIAPGAHLAGEVTMGDGTFVGTGGSVIPGMVVGAWASIGAGSVVVRPVADGTTVAGSPARLLRED